MSVQCESDAEIIEIAAKVAKHLNEFVQINLGAEKAFDVTPGGGVLLPKKRLLSHE